MSVTAVRHRHRRRKDSASAVRAKSGERRLRQQRQTQTPPTRTGPPTRVEHHDGERQDMRGRRRSEHARRRLRKVRRGKRIEDPVDLLRFPREEERAQERTHCVFNRQSSPVEQLRKTVQDRDREGIGTTEIFAAWRARGGVSARVRADDRRHRVSFHPCVRCASRTLRTPPSPP